MSIPNSEEVRILSDYVRNDISLRLYSNDITPGESTELGDFTQVSGGGYLPKTLLTSNWIISPNDPSVAVYAEQTFAFTGTTAGPGTIYGYYLVDLDDGAYIGGDRFPGSITPFTPISGSQIKITPKVLVS